MKQADGELGDRTPRADLEDAVIPQAIQETTAIREAREKALADSQKAAKSKD